jgi:hypothetical protein
MELRSKKSNEAAGPFATLVQFPPSAFNRPYDAGIEVPGQVSRVTVSGNFHHPVISPIIAEHCVRLVVTLKQRKKRHS